MSDFLLARQGPLPAPMCFNLGVTKEGEPEEWPLLPIATLAIAQEMERFVARHVMMQAEKRKPDADDEDAATWAAYASWKEDTRRDLDTGEYSAFSRNWEWLLRFNPDCIREAIYQCVRLKNPRWTRKHVKELFNSDRTPLDTDTSASDVLAAYREQNWPAPQKKIEEHDSSTQDEASPKSESPSTGKANSTGS